MPSASTVAWRRSASAPTAVTTRATSTRVALGEQPQVELDHVGIEQRHHASERESPPTSSSDTPQPRVRSAVSVRRTASGRSVSALSVISITSVAPLVGRSGRSSSSAPASALRKSANGAPRPGLGGGAQRRRAAFAVDLAQRARGARGGEQLLGEEPSRGRASAS